MTAPDAPPQYLKPLKPRRGLFWLLLAVYFVWMLALGAMWYTTVYTRGGRLIQTTTTTP